MATSGEHDRARLLAQQPEQGGDGHDERPADARAYGNAGVQDYAQYPQAQQYAQPVMYAPADQRQGFNQQYFQGAPIAVAVPTGYMPGMHGYAAPGRHQFVLEEQEHYVYGKWKDGLCECCGTGSCQTTMYAFGPSCCWPCLFAKIASRMNWSPGLPTKVFGNTPFKQWLRLFLILISFYWTFVVTAKYYLVLTKIQIAQENPDTNSPTPAPDTPYISEAAKKDMAESGIYETLARMVMIVMVILAFVLRQRVRRHFRIHGVECCCPGGASPDGACAAAEDLCVSCCPCTSVCAMAQVARHTLAAGSICDPLSDPGPLPFPTHPAAVFAAAATAGRWAPPEAIHMHPYPPPPPADAFLPYPYPYPYPFAGVQSGVYPPPVGGAPAPQPYFPPPYSAAEAAAAAAPAAPATAAATGIETAQPSRVVAQTSPACVA